MSVENQIFSCMDQVSVLTEQLIENVYLHPVLYDLNNIDYKNNRKKDRIWEEIGKDLNEPGAVLKKKWKNLRDTHMKYLRGRKTHTGQARKNYKGWQWATIMERFTPFVSFAGTETNVSRSNVLSRHSPPQSVLPHDDVDDDDGEAAAQTTSNTNQVGTVSVRKRQRCDARSMSNTDKVLQYLQGKTRMMEDVDYLMQGYAQTIKKLSPRGQAIAKMKIGQIVSELELEELETNVSRNSGTSSNNSMIEYPNFSTPEDCSLSLYNTFQRL